ncbi:hypothetical protein Syun_023292 [Stephania yunnanensis]|uniref:Cytochrome P450 n=1 Tax=Stephania yunnanensis TaxID=152371 RepID=A0AAP0I3A1_9MAGN
MDGKHDFQESSQWSILSEWVLPQGVRWCNDLKYENLILNILGITLIIVLCMILDLIQELSERSDGCGYVFIGANSESGNSAHEHGEQQESLCLHLYSSAGVTGKRFLRTWWIEKIEKSWSEGKILEEAKTINKSFLLLVIPWPALFGILQDAPGVCSRTHNGKGVVVVGNQKSGLDIVVECASLILTASDSPAGKSTNSLIREPGELVKIKYTDVPLLYYTEILRYAWFDSYARTRIASTAKTIVDERIGNGEVSNKQGDFLQILLSANTLSDNEKLSFVLDSLLGGYETTSLLMVMVVQFLGQTPATMAQLKIEHENIRRDKGEGEHLN